MSDFDINLLGKRYTELNPTVEALQNSLLAIYKAGEPELNKITFEDFQHSFELKNSKDFYQKILVDGGFVKYDNTASKFIQGSLVVGDIPTLPASKITSGVFDVARIPDLAISKITDLSNQLNGKEPSFQKGNVISNYLTITNGTGRAVGIDDLIINLNVDQLINQIKQDLDFYVEEKFTFSASYNFTLQNSPIRERVILFHVGTKLGVILDDTLYSITGSTLTINTELEVDDVIKIEYYYDNPASSNFEVNLQDVTNVGNVTTLPLIHAPATSNNQSATFGQVIDLLNQFSVIPDSNYLIQKGNISNVGNILTLDGTIVDKEWIVRINGQNLINDTSQDFTLTPPASAQFRRDLIYINSFGDYAIETGVAAASGGSSLLPQVPADSVAIGEVLLNDTGIDEIYAYTGGTFVSYEIDQFLSDNQKLRARINIQAVSRESNDYKKGFLYFENSSGNNVIRLNSNSDNILELYNDDLSARRVAFRRASLTGLGNLSAIFLLKGVGVGTRTLTTWVNSNDVSIFSMLDNGTHEFNGNGIRNGNLTQNGVLKLNSSYIQNSPNWAMNGRNWVLTFPDDTHSYTSFTIKNSRPTNPGGMFMTERGSVIFRAKGDSLTDYYIVRFQGSDAIQRIEINNNGILANQRSASELYLLRRDELYLNYPYIISESGKVNNVVLLSGYGMIKFSSYVTEVSGIQSNNESIELIVITENPLGITLNQEDEDSLDENRFYEQIYLPYLKPIKLIYNTDLDRWIQLSAIPESIDATKAYQDTQVTLTGLTKASLLNVDEGSLSFSTEDMAVGNRYKGRLIIDNTWVSSGDYTLFLNLGGQEVSIPVSTIGTTGTDLQGILDFSVYFRAGIDTARTFSFKGLYHRIDSTGSPEDIAIPRTELTVDATTAKVFDILWQGDDASNETTLIDFELVRQ